jgi:hypothetical protein
MPLVAAVVIVSLGVGIGVNSAVFSWIQALVLKPLPGVDAPSAFYLVEPRDGHRLISGIVVAGSWKPAPNAAIR